MNTSTLFKLGIAARYRLYRSGVLPTKRLEHPVISIGNLTVGGTGKTPLTIFLAEKLAACGFRPVILSRGYRRRTRGCVVVSRGDGPLTSWQDAGDEPFLIARKLAGRAAVVVGESRFLAGVTAQREHLGDLFLLDDGFQHLQLHRDFDIVTIDPDEWQRGESLLPTGRWREPKSAITRAQAACVHCIQGEASLDLSIPQFTVRLSPDPEQVTWLKHKSITAFSGIAKPERFIATLKSVGLQVRRQVSFADHHNYLDDDLKTLQDEVLLTTEKDAVKLEARGNFVAFHVSANIPEFERLQDLILGTLRHS